MPDTLPPESQPAGPIPPDDPARDLAVARPVSMSRWVHVGVVGDTYTILLSGADTAGRYTLVDRHVPPGGAAPPPHRHDFEEMFSILDGEIELTFRGQTMVAGAGAGAGETVNVPANAPHVFRNASDRPARLLCLCSPAGQEGLLPRGERPGRASHGSATGLRRGRASGVRCGGSGAGPSVPDRAAPPGPRILNVPPTPPAGDATMSQQQREAIETMLRDGLSGTLTEVVLGHVRDDAVDDGVESATVSVEMWSARHGVGPMEVGPLGLSDRCPGRA